MHCIFGMLRLLHRSEFPIEDQSSSFNWQGSSDLGLTSELDREWEQFRLALINSGALIIEKEDRLRWVRGDDSGFPTVIFFYLTIINQKI
jgi:hypothetical protein